MNTYALIEEKTGYLINIMVWDGNLENWQPPVGMIAKPIEEVDMETIERPIPDGI